jgi:type I restriction enzyme R subunit
VFEDLFLVHEGLDQEERRYSREGFDNEEQLAVFDLLSKDKTELTKADLDKIKKVAKALLASLETRKQEMANLRDRASAQANLKAAIIDEMLNGMPEEFSNEEIDIRAEALFLHVGGGFGQSMPDRNRLN